MPYVLSGSALLGFVGALAVLDAERTAPGANITAFGDAMWWVVTIMTTVGYGEGKITSAEQEKLTENPQAAMKHDLRVALPVQQLSAQVALQVFGAEKRMHITTARQDVRGPNQRRSRVLEPSPVVQQLG